MKISNISGFLTLACFVVLTGCEKKFDDYSQNKNLPLEVPPGLILPAILNDMVVYPGGYEDKADQFIVSNYTYYGNNEYWTGSASLNYGSLRNVLKMESEARRLNNGSDDNPYHALGLFFRAFFFVSMSEKVGDLPMTDALQGLDNTTPKYNTQKEIFMQSLAWLDSANSIIAKELPLLDIDASYYEFSGDYYYKEALTKPFSSTPAALRQWQKAINSYRLRVLIELSHYMDDKDLNITNQFGNIISNPSQYPIFTGNDDNLQYAYNSSYNYYPDNPNNYGNNAGRLNIAATLLNNLSNLHDLRAMILAEPARGLTRDSAGKNYDGTKDSIFKIRLYTDTSYRSFVGGASGDDVSTLATQSGAGKISLYNFHHFYSTYTAEPTLILSYPEMCYNIAEAINRGWTTGDAESWYINGTEAMFSFYGIVDGNNEVVFRNNNGSADLVYTVPFSYYNYFNQPLVKYKGNTPDGLNQILLEKYLAYARNSGLQAYYQWRRTNVPAFSAGTGTGNSNKIPLRFQYPTNEKTTNSTNVTDAIQRQFMSAGDDINAQMWLIK